MKKIAIVGAAAALFAIPAAANAQAFVQVETGLDAISSGGESKSGVDYGISAGYDMPLSGGMFVGIQGTVADSTAKDCASDVLVVGDRACLKTGRDLAAVVRLGTSVGDTNKLYLLGGYTNARLVATYTDGTNSAKASDTGDGFRLGAGAEHDFGHNLFGKVEYRYSNYKGDFSRHNVLAGLGMKF